MDIKQQAETKVDNAFVRLGKFVARHPLVDLGVIVGLCAIAVFMGVL